MTDENGQKNACEEAARGAEALAAARILLAGGFFGVKRCKKSREPDDLSRLAGHCCAGDDDPF